MQDPARQRDEQATTHNSHRMPEGSTFYERIVPALLLGMAVITTGLILFALGVLLRIIPFS